MDDTKAKVERDKGEQCSRGWVFPKIRVFPPKWMVKIMANPIKMDDLGVPLFSETSGCGWLF